MVVRDMVSTDLGETEVVGNFMVSQDKKNMVVGNMVFRDQEKFVGRYMVNTDQG